MKEKTTIQAGQTFLLLLVLAVLTSPLVDKYSPYHSYYSNGQSFLEILEHWQFIRIELLSTPIILISFS